MTWAARAVSLLVLMVACQPSCAAQAFQPETPHPSAARIAELLALPVAHPLAPAVLAQFAIRLIPAFVFAGGSAWIVCDVPERDGPGILRFGIEGLRVSGPNVLQQVDNRILIERIGCGDHLAFCTFTNRDGRMRQVDIHLTALGDCSGNSKESRQ
jgi:hypothetical protein